MSGSVSHLLYQALYKHFKLVTNTLSCLIHVTRAKHLERSVNQQSPTFPAPGTSFAEDSFSMDRWGGGGLVLR